jgi:hypothetical protein
MFREFFYLQKTLILLLAAVALFLTSCAGKNICKGQRICVSVIEKSNKEPIVNAVIQSTDNRFFTSVRTDDGGRYCFLIYKSWFIIRPKMPAFVTKLGYDTLWIKNLFKIKKPLELTVSITDSIYGFAEKMPEFIGRQESLLIYLSKNFSFPSREDIQMSMIASFTIDTLGNIISPQIVSPRYTDRLTPAEKEFLRVIRLMPAWIPGEHKGKKVNVKMVLPLKF